MSHKCSCSHSWNQGQGQGYDQKHKCWGHSHEDYEKKCRCWVEKYCECYEKKECKCRDDNCTDCRKYYRINNYFCCDNHDHGCSGNSGATGNNGATGEQGATGSAGNTGATGAPGKDGATGNTGASGAPGKNGVTGADGKDGATGPAGATGDGAPASPLEFSSGILSAPTVLAITTPFLSNTIVIGDGGSIVIPTGIAAPDCLRQSYAKPLSRNGIAKSLYATMCLVLGGAIPAGASTTFTFTLRTAAIANSSGISPPQPFTSTLLSTSMTIDSTTPTNIMGVDYESWDLVNSVPITAGTRYVMEVSTSHTGTEVALPVVALSLNASIIYE